MAMTSPPFTAPPSKIQAFLLTMQGRRAAEVATAFQGRPTQAGTPNAGRTPDSGPPARKGGTAQQARRITMTLGQTCPPECWRAQYAFKNSMIHWNSAIHITYRISLRSSSMPEPRDPLLKVLIHSLNAAKLRRCHCTETSLKCPPAGAQGLLAPGRSPLKQQ